MNGAAMIGMTMTGVTARNKIRMETAMLKGVAFAAGAAALLMFGSPAKACGLFVSTCGGTAAVHGDAYYGYDHHRRYAHDHGGYDRAYHAGYRHRHARRAWVYKVPAYPPPTPRYYVNQGPTYSGPGTLPFRARYEDRDIRMGYRYVHAGHGGGGSGYGYADGAAPHSSVIQADAEVRSTDRDELVIRLRRRPE